MRIHRTLRAVVAAAAIGGLGAAGCSGSDASPATSTSSATQTAGTAGASPTGSTDRTDIARAVVTDVIVPAYESLAASTTALVDALAAACAAEQVDLTDARTAWRTARGAWEFTRAFRFGPVMELRAASSIDFPADPDKVGSLIDGSDPLDIDAVADLGADQRGLSGVELVLFTDGEATERECEYLMSASSLVAARAGEIAAAWAADTSAVDETKMFIDDAVNGIVFALTDVSGQRLGPASGATVETAEFAEVDAGPARSARDDLIAVTSGAAGVLGALDPLVRSQSSDAADRAIAELDVSLDAITAITPPIAAGSDLDAITAAYEVSRAALVTIRTEVASLLGVTLTLGDADGDS